MEKPDRPAATPYPPPESRQANPTTARTAIHGRASADRGSGIKTASLTARAEGARSFAA